MTVAPSSANDLGTGIGTSSKGLPPSTEDMTRRNDQMNFRHPVVGPLNWGVAESRRLRGAWTQGQFLQ